MGDPDSIKVCLIDDHQIVIEGLRLLIESADDIQCVFTAGGAEEGLRLLSEHQVDIVMLDIEMPGTDGIALCSIIKSSHPHIRVIALTMYNERSLVRQMIEAGADGYLLKNTNRDELLAAIRRVYSGKSYYDTEIAEILVRGDSSPKSKEQLFPSLSSREKQIVRLIMDECTSPQIADQLNISLNTVETHRRNIMTKLNTKNSAGIVRIAIEYGLLGD